MVHGFRVRRHLLHFKIPFLATLFLIVFVIIRFIYVSLKNNNNPICISNEPIDVIYTWVNGSDRKFLEDLNEYLSKNHEDIDSSMQRYSDKNELKFSLRSLEKYAPWVNHVYIVTNGQIPYWLNLDYEKVSIITHEQIFTNLDNLPTFSSPAIERNLHKIPGLTKKFIYFNDDIFLGMPTYPDDFYTQSRGYFIYLAYGVTECAPNCPWMYVADEQCDKACNNIKCQWDGGDCKYSNSYVSQEKINSTEVEMFDNLMREKIQTIRKKLHKSYDTEYRITVPENITKTNVTEKTILSILKKSTTYANVSEIIREHNKKVLHKSKLRRWKKAFLKANNKTKTVNQNLDAYSESLQHTNRLLNLKYGYKARKVPTHSPIMIDRDVMERLQETFENEFDITEKNRFRKANDFQYSFSYYYFLMSEGNEKTVGEIFDDFDTDMSGTWSDREIRNLLSQLYALPLTYDIVDEFESMLLNCSLSKNLPEVPTPLYERYIDSRLTTISRILVINCQKVARMLSEKFGNTPKYKYEIIKNPEYKHVWFKMLRSNVSDVVRNHDEIRSEMKKFVCLNDNLDTWKLAENELVRAILYDFYLSLFPLPSKFELPEDSRNRFLRMDKLEEWRKQHYTIKVCIICAIVLIWCFLLFNIFKKRCCQMFNTLFC